MLKFKIGDKVKWKSTDNDPFPWQQKGKVTATGEVRSVSVENITYPYLVTCSEGRGASYLACDDDIEKLVLNLENK